MHSRIPPSFRTSLRTSASPLAWRPSLIPLLLLLGLAAAGCRSGSHTPTPDASFPDAGPPRLDAGAVFDAGDAAPPTRCACPEGPHTALIYLMSGDGELYSYDPVAGEFAYVLGPACATTERPYSMAVDQEGRAWILYSTSRRIQTLNLLDLGACEDSGYLPTNPDFGLFGMSFVTAPEDRGGDGCASLHGISYSGEGPFGPGEGAFGVVDRESLRMSTLGPTAYNGGELAGTGDGRVFAFVGDLPTYLLELDRETGEVTETTTLEGFSHTNASAFAFFGGDIYLFTEAVPPTCISCLEANCPAAYEACEADPTCAADLACAIEAADIRDDCGGGTGAEMHACLMTCTDQCFVPPRVRVSKVTFIDYDRSDGGDRSPVTLGEAPIRVVGAASSPCVPVGPF